MLRLLKRAPLPGLAALLLLILFCGISYSHASSQAAGLRDTFHKDYARLRTTDRDQRLVETYGDRTIMGFGYLRGILKGIPDSGLFPKVRYHYYSMNEAIVFPHLHSRVTDKMLVGIDLRPEDLQEIKIAAAVRISAQDGPDKAATGWAFVTDWEYDRLSAIKVSFASAPPGPLEIHAVMLTSPHDFTPVGEWQWKLANPAASELLQMDKPMKNLYGRGSLPYVLFLEAGYAAGGPGPAVQSVEVLGTKVSLEGYTPFHLEKSCFAALGTPFLVEILRTKDIQWLDYLLRVSNVPEVRQAAEAARGHGLRARPALSQEPPSSGRFKDTEGEEH